MAGFWSEENKVVNALEPKADRFATSAQSDIVHCENFKRCTFLIMTGATANNTNTVAVHAGPTSTGAATTIPFKYRSITSGDTYGALTTVAAGSSFAFTASSANQYHIVEVDVSDVAAAGTNYDHCAVTVTEAGSATAQLGCIVAVLSEPRDLQSVLITAID